MWSCSIHVHDINYIDYIIEQLKTGAQPDAMLILLDQADISADIVDVLCKVLHYSPLEWHTALDILRDVRS